MRKNLQRRRKQDLIFIDIAFSKRAFASMIRLVDVGSDVEDPLDAHCRVALLLIFECGDDVDDDVDDDDHDIDGDIVDDDTIEFLKNIFLFPLSGDHLHSSAARATTHHLWNQVVGDEILQST